METKITTVEQRGNFITLANAVELASGAISKVQHITDAVSKEVHGVSQTRQIIAEGSVAAFSAKLLNGAR